MHGKKMLKCKVTIGILLGWFVFSVIGFLGKDTVYKNYQADVKTTPYFVLVLQGVHDGIYPWNDSWGRVQETVLEQQSVGGQKEDEPQKLENESPVLTPDNGDGQKTAVTPDEGKVNEADSADEKSSEKIDGADNADEKSSETISKADNADEESSEKINEADSADEKSSETISEAERWSRMGEFVEVDESYFDDAVFIGDSRTVGLRDYGGLDGATFYATVGMNIYDLWTDCFCDVDGKQVTLEEALTQKQYKKVYFQIGINEMGRGTVDSFMEVYEQCVEKFKELQPDAVIYVQGIMRVAGEKSDSDPVFNNSGINERNERIAALADNRRVFYIDVNEVVCDESGNLKEELTFDSLHLYGSKYGIWVDFLKTKGIQF